MDFTTLAIVGTAVSLLVSVIKSIAGANGKKALGITIGVSFVGAGAYYFLHGTGFWRGFVEVLGIANAIYMVLTQFLDDGIKKLVTPSND